MHAKFQQKIMTIALVIAKFEYLTFDSYILLRWGQRGGVKFDTAMLIYRHWAIMVFSEKLLNIKAFMKCEDIYSKKLILVLHYNCHKHKKTH